MFAFDTCRWEEIEPKSQQLVGIVKYVKEALAKVHCFCLFILFIWFIIILSMINTNGCAGTYRNVKYCKI